jgi:AraC-like DNA-binding protein
VADADRAAGEIVRWWKPQGLDGIEMLSVSRSSRLWKLFHETHTLCALTSLDGELEWDHRGRRHASARGSLMLIDQGEVHSACRRPSPASFRALMIAPAAMASLSLEITGESIPRWRRADLRSPRHFEAFNALHDVLDSEASSLEKETRLVAFLADLLGGHSEARPRMARASGLAASAGAGLQRAREELHAHCLEDLSLSRLAATAGLSRSHFCRRFARAFGLPPHQYQLRLRMAKARSWLASGRPFAAPDLGFCDQSQFIREFKHILGVTPGAYARALRA